MNARHALLPAAAALAVLADAPAAAQHLHTNDTWEECSIVLDEHLSQASWDEWVGEVGNVVYFRPISDARAMGRGNFEFAILGWASRIDDRKDAWNDTFSHPDSTHYLVEGDALVFPGVTARAGVTERLDVGAYFTQNPNANYGFYGGQAQYALTDEATFPVSTATRASFVQMFGPDDAKVGVYGVDLVVSRELAVASGLVSVSPYAVVSGMLSRGRETTAAVDLDDVNALAAHGTLGVALDVRALRLGAEYSIGRVDTYSLKIAFGI